MSFIVVLASIRFFLLTASILYSFVSVVFLSSLLVYFTGSFVLSTDSLLCDMLVTFGSFVCCLK